jgi:hypothetical protein
MATGMSNLTSMKKKRTCSQKKRTRKIKALRKEAEDSDVRFVESSWDHLCGIFCPVSKRRGAARDALASVYQEKKKKRDLRFLAIGLLFTFGRLRAHGK